MSAARPTRSTTFRRKAWSRNSHHPRRTRHPAGPAKPPPKGLNPLPLPKPRKSPLLRPPLTRRRQPPTLPFSRRHRTWCAPHRRPPRRPGPHRQPPLPPGPVRAALRLISLVPPFSPHRHALRSPASPRPIQLALRGSPPLSHATMWSANARHVVQAPRAPPPSRSSPRHLRGAPIPQRRQPLRSTAPVRLHLRQPVEGPPPHPGHPEVRAA